jgi:hypothetical protein
MIDIEICKFLLDEVKRLRAERDEARVDACRLEAEARSRFARMSGMSCHYFSPKQIAKEREWDCFKEASDGK